MFTMYLTRFLPIIRGVRLSSAYACISFDFHKVDGPISYFLLVILAERSFFKWLIVKVDLVRVDEPFNI